MNDFDDAPETNPDAVPVDLTELAEAEDLAVTGPVDADLEGTPMPFPDTDSGKTPVRQSVCRECQGVVWHVENGWRAPMSADEAWRAWNVACVVREDGAWSFCVHRGVCWIGPTGHDYERRRAARRAPWDGDRRRT